MHTVLKFNSLFGLPPSGYGLGVALTSHTWTSYTAQRIVGTKFLELGVPERSLLLSLGCLTRILSLMSSALLQFIGSDHLTMHFLNR